MKILILASNPRKDLNLDREIRDLQGVIERSRNRAELEVKVGLAVRVGDLQDLLFQHQPQIVHFCGHGSGVEGLVLEGEEGDERWVKAEALAELFRLFPGVRCVLLNACYSEEQANAIVTHIDYVIGMRQTIRDDAAIAFSKGFYRALGHDCSIEQSFDFGCNAIQLEISGSSRKKSLERSLVSEQQRQMEVVEAAAIAIPEHDKPVLKKKASLGDDAGFIPAEAQVAIQVEVSKALEEEDSSLREYREQVQEYLNDRQLEPHEKLMLDLLRDELGLSVEETDRILEEEFAPILQARQAYEQRLTALIQGEFDPFNLAIAAELKKFQARRNLTDAEVKAISQPIFAAKETARQAELRQQEAQRQQEEEEKQHRYRQELLRALSSAENFFESHDEQPKGAKQRLNPIALVRFLKKSQVYHLIENPLSIGVSGVFCTTKLRATQAAYPIAEPIWLALKAFQQQIGLSDDAASAIEQPILERLEVEHQERLLQREAERLRREAEERQRQEQAEAKRRPQMRSFEFRIATIDCLDRQIEKSGWFGKKTETEKVCNISYQKGQVEYFAEVVSNTVTLEMASIAGGSFQMGSPENNGDADERPQHRVTIDPFYMGRYAITQAQWKAVATLPQVDRLLEANPSRSKSCDRPVKRVSWNDAIEFCARLSSKTGREYRLPSEAQWEYACRAGTATPFHCGETIASNLANYDTNYNYGTRQKRTYRKETIAVGSFPPNAFGLYDMHGNVWEWCTDNWHENYQGAPTNGSTWLEDGDRTYRMVRGGSWFNHPWNCRSADRLKIVPGNRYSNIGFRVVCVSAMT